MEPQGGLGAPWGGLLEISLSPAPSAPLLRLSLSLK